jgi:hypothetical protein
MTMKKAKHNAARPIQRREFGVALAFIVYLPVSGLPRLSAPPGAIAGCWVLVVTAGSLGFVRGEPRKPATASSEVTAG